MVNFQQAFKILAPKCVNCGTKYATHTFKYQFDSRDCCRLEHCKECAAVRSKPENPMIPLPWIELAENENLSL